VAGTVRLSDVWQMLNRCAPGYTKVEKPSYWWVEYKGKRFPQLPKGGPSERNPEIRVGVIRQLITQLEIDKMKAAEELPILRQWAASNAKERQS
jgi:hypothetical protein